LEFDGARWAAVIPAAGTGLRMQNDIPKQFLTIGHKPVLIHTLTTIASCPAIKAIIVVVPYEAIESTAQLINDYGIGKIDSIVVGGKTRQISVSKGVSALPTEYDYVLIHDGVRPLVDHATIERVMKAAREEGAATAGIKTTDTLGEVDRHHHLKSIQPRKMVWQIQTPQAFWRPLLTEAQLKAEADNFEGTDESSLLLRMNRPVKIVEGSPANIKLTTKYDLNVAKALTMVLEEV
jgi:2-C-methyl-D-erythritol 4-phosphate cytidylyltransferase